MRTPQKVSVNYISSISRLAVTFSMMVVLILVSGNLMPANAQRGYGTQKLTFENDAGTGNGTDQAPGPDEMRRQPDIDEKPGMFPGNSGQKQQDPSFKPQVPGHKKPVQPPQGGIKNHQPGPPPQRLEKPQPGQSPAKKP